MAYKEVAVEFPSGKKGKALLDTERQLLIFNFMTTELAKHLGFKWEDKEAQDENSKNKEFARCR